MAACEECGEETSMPFRCKFCEAQFCSDHRLPENHDCGGLRDYTDRSRQEGTIGYDVMEEAEDVTPTTDVRRSSSLRDRLTRLRGRAQRRLPFRTATAGLLAVIAAVYVLQVVDAATGMFGGELFRLFVLDADTVVARPWTLFTSIVLHGSLMHLVVNGIVLYSFGTSVERLLGTRRFLAVVLGAALASSVAFVVGMAVYGVVPDLGPGITISRAVGLSGGLYGIVALLAVLRPRVTVLAFFIVPLRIRTAVGAFLAMDVVNAAAHALGYPLLPFASAGHLGGAAVGLALGWLWRDRYRRSRHDHLLDLMRHRPVNV